MTKKPYLEDFLDVEVTLHGCTFEISGTVAFDINLLEGYFDYDIADIDIKSVLVPSGDAQTDKDFIKFFWQAGRSAIQVEIDDWLHLYHGSLLDNEPPEDEK